MDISPPQATRLFFEGDAFFQQLHLAIEAAKKNIDIEIYIFAHDDIGRALSDLLKQKSREGVCVRVLYDAIGCRDTGDDFFQDLEDAGCHVKAFHPLLEVGAEFTRRNHRKFVVIDQKEAFLGGYNFTNDYSEKYSGKKAWRDTGVQIEIEDAVQELVQLFENTWHGRWRDFSSSLKFSRRKPSQEKHILPNFGLRRLNWIRQEYVSRIIRAQKRIYLTQSYFVPDFGLIRALRKAALRGVDVRVMTAGESDLPFVRWCSQGTYHRLLSAGVRIFEYQGRMMHAKTGVMDTQWWTVGTANMDHMSLFRNLEVNFVSADSEQASALESQFLEDLKSCQEITFEKWKVRSWTDRALEQFALLFRHWV